MRYNLVDKLWKIRDIVGGLYWIIIPISATSGIGRVYNAFHPHGFHQVAHIYCTQILCALYLCNFAVYPHYPQHLLLPQPHKILKKEYI